MSGAQGVAISAAKKPNMASRHPCYWQNMLTFLDQKKKSCLVLNQGSSNGLSMRLIGGKVNREGSEVNLGVKCARCIEQ